MVKYLMVGVGGAVGSVLRFWLGSYIGGRLGSRFPYGTFVVNISGSFLIGIVLTVLAETNPLERQLALPDPHWIHRRLYHFFSIRV